MKPPWASWRLAVLCSAAAVLASCTKPNPRYCNEDADCAAETPFCDVAGEYEESDHTDHFCIEQPASCPVERCGCTPGATLSCTGDTLAVCGADGRSSSSSACAFGCADATRCFAFCSPNAPSCGANGALFMCDGEGTQLTKVQDCQYGCTTDRCNACAASTTFCNGNNLATCDANGQITNPMSCQFGCQGNACNACMPNTTFCQGTNAVTCTAAGQAGTTQSCGAAGCQDGVCNSCTPNTTSCQGDNLVVCNAGGTVQSATSCALGCGTSPGAHCKVLVPSFGLPSPSGSQPDLVLTADAQLDISNCANLDVKLTVGGTTTAVSSAQIASVAQAGGSPICSVKYGAISVPDTFTLTIVNSTAGHLLSLQGTGSITIGGRITFNTAAQGPAPGGSVLVAGTNANGSYMAPGGGGAGGARAGGTGGACTACSGGSTVLGGAGGASIALGNLLLSGSAGGNVTMNGAVIASGGRGGGGLHLVSLTRVTFDATAVIGLNGGGGTGPANTTGCLACNPTAGGGGSGGVLVVEAPTVNVSGGAIAAANGGGGAGGDTHLVSSGGTFYRLHYNGQPGQLSTTRAAGGDIENTAFGDGGYEADGTASPSENGAASDSGAATYGGGGGGAAKGFIVLRGRAAANVMIAFGATISPMPLIGAVNAQ